MENEAERQGWEEKTLKRNEAGGMESRDGRNALLEDLVNHSLSITENSQHRFEQSLNKFKDGAYYCQRSLCSACA